MSRYYNMAVTITGAAHERVDAVKEAAAAEWSFDDWQLDPKGVLTASADDRLCGGETEDEFVERLTKAIWTANGSFCEVEVNATYLEDLPCETHCLDKDQYDQFLSAADKSAETQEDRNNG